MKRAATRLHRIAGAIAGLWSVGFVCLLIGHAAVPSRIPFWAVVGDWFGGIAILGAVVVYNKWAYGVYLPFSGRNSN